MQHLLGYLPLLACPVGMGAMMWMMARVGNSQHRSSEPTPPAAMTPQQQSELQRLRAELDEIRAADRQRDDVTASRHTPRQPS